MNEQVLQLTPTDFVAITNQSLEHIFANVLIEGELANLRISKNRWLYFDIKDEFSKVSCFGSVTAMPGPLKDGMMIKIIGQPRLHPQFGFKVNIQSIQPTGEGSIKKAYELLRAKLLKEGLFDEERKRPLPYPPKHIALVTSVESAAYADFIKIINVRWPFLTISVYDTQVQGESAPLQLIKAIEKANKSPDLAEVLIVIRGGGSGDDLAAFDDERVVRAISASRIPTMVAIGHEIDESLSELVADKKASTPSNAAELLVPDKSAEAMFLKQQMAGLISSLQSVIDLENIHLANTKHQITMYLQGAYQKALGYLDSTKLLLHAYNPENILKRGYSIVKLSNKVVKDIAQVSVGQIINVKILNGSYDASVKKINK